MKILNFGSLNIDLVYQVDHHVKSGETLSPITMERFCGGKGLNQSIALKRAGANVYHAGCIGSDGECLVSLLNENGVDTSLIRTVGETSGNAVIQVDKNGENCILLYGGTNQKVTTEHIDEALLRFEAGDLLLLQNEINNLEELITKAYDKGMIIALNPSPINDIIFKLPLEKVTYFILNEIEGNEITGKSSAEEIIKELNNRYENSKIVLTLGKKGSIYSDRNVYITQKIYNATVVDTTAAGDTFTGYFLQSIMDGALPKEALDIAARASALAVSKMGAAPSIPLMQEVLNANFI